MKILVTGSSGLVGRNVTELFKNTEHKLLAPSHAELDLLKRDDVFRYLDENKPDCVIHLAAKVGSIASNARYPLQFFLENLDIARNVIIGAKETGIKKFINIGSACVYPAEKCDLPLSEDLAATGSFEKEYKGYAAGKTAGLFFCEFINAEEEYYLYKTLIPCSIYGRWSSFEVGKSTMIASAIKKIYHAKKLNLPEVEIWGDGNARRELIYAGDLAKIILYATENLETFPAQMNVGTGVEHTVNECYEIIAKILDYKGAFVHDINKPSGARRRLLDVSLMLQTGLKPETSLEEGIRRTIRFYEDHILKNSEEKV